jgi:triosephosphate isomerase
MAQKIVAGNWKMNLEKEEAFDLVNQLNEKIEESTVRVIAFPPSIYVLPISKMSQGKFDLGVQNFYAKSAGAYTGEISIPQVKSVGGSIGLIGHSERREYFQEGNEFLKEKVDAALENSFEFIFCCGEPLEVREVGEELNFVKKQLEESLFHLSAEQMWKAIIAYEPIWAIGTGRTASAEQAEDMHANIRSWVEEKYNEETAKSVTILYGGSCKPENAKELFACPNIDGGLIGGAALKADDFCAIINAF